MGSAGLTDGTLTGCKHVLHADDDDNDRLLVELSFSNSNLPLDYHGVSDGSQVLDYLDGRGKFRERSAYPFPDALVLDLKMNRMGGFDVLEWVHSQPHTAKLPVMVNEFLNA